MLSDNAYSYFYQTLIGAFASLIFIGAFIATTGLYASIPLVLLFSSLSWASLSYKNLIDEVNKDDEIMDTPY